MTDKSNPNHDAWIPLLPQIVVGAKVELWQGLFRKPEACSATITNIEYDVDVGGRYRLEVDIYPKCSFSIQWVKDVLPAKKKYTFKKAKHEPEYHDIPDVLELDDNDYVILQRDGADLSAYFVGDAPVLPGFATSGGGSIIAGNYENPDKVLRYDTYIKV